MIRVLLKNISKSERPTFLCGAKQTNDNLDSKWRFSGGNKSTFSLFLHTSFTRRVFSPQNTVFLVIAGKESECIPFRWQILKLFVSCSLSHWCFTGRPKEKESLQNWPYQDFSSISPILGTLNITDCYKPFVNGTALSKMHLS